MAPLQRILLVPALLGLAAGCESTVVRSTGPQRPSPSDDGFDDESDEDDDGLDDDVEEVEERPSFPGPENFPRRPAGPPPARLSKVIIAEQTPPPISGGTLTVTKDGAFAVAADPDRDSVYVVDLTNRSAQTAKLAAKSEPGRTVLDGAGRAHVLLRGPGKVARLDLATAAVVQETEVCQHPRGLAYDASKDALLVACASGELVTLAAATHAELSRAVIALDLRDVVVTTSGERFVSRYRSAELLKLDAAGKVVKTSRPASESALFRPSPVSMLPALAWRTVEGPSGRPVMVHQKSQAEEVVVQQGGYGAGCSTITQPGATEFDANGEPIRTVTFNASAYAVDVAVSSESGLLAFASPSGYLSGSQGTVQIVPTSQMMEPVPPPPPQPPATPGSDDVRDDDVPVKRDAGVRTAGSRGCSPTMAGGHDLQVTAVAFDANGLLYAFSREPAQLIVYAVGTQLQFGAPLRVSDSILLDTRSVRDSGHEMFHADVGSGLACASCHGEALDDAHVWKFQNFGPRRTQNMRGGIARTLPLHWEGDMRDFQHLVDEVMTGRMGGFKVAPEYTKALEHWLDVLPPVRINARDAEAAKRGKALFESEAVACATCHAGEATTNNENADVGTGGSFQVPSLHGLALRAPYMHDGCAATLRDRFDPKCGGGDKHGKTSQLSAKQIGDLVAYLETL